jgi:hypothetical protein
MHLGPIDGEHLNARQPGARAQPEHLAKQSGQRGLMALTEPCDRAVIGLPVGRDQPERDVLDALPLDHS